MYILCYKTVDEFSLCGPYIRILGYVVGILAPENFGTHYLHYGGAIAMHTAAVPDWTLVAIGWWRFLVFMVCILQHISSFSTGVSVKTSQQH